MKKIRLDRPTEDKALDRVEKKEPGSSWRGSGPSKKKHHFPGSKTLKKGTFYVRL